MKPSRPSSKEDEKAAIFARLAQGGKPGSGPGKKSSAVPAPVGGEKDIEAFMEYVKREGKRALAALLHNVFAVKQESGYLNFYVDHSHANLIPMMRSPQNLPILEQLARQFFGGKPDINFSVAGDPKVRQEKELEANALAVVQADPKVKYIMENLDGTIVNCKVLDQS